MKKVIMAPVMVMVSSVAMANGMEADRMYVHAHTECNEQQQAPCYSVFSKRMATENRAIFTPDQIEQMDNLQVSKALYSYQLVAWDVLKSHVDNRDANEFRTLNNYTYYCAISGNLEKKKHALLEWWDNTRPFADLRSEKSTDLRVG